LSGSISAGAVPVRLTKNGRDLWLVVSKAAGRGYTWYLAHLPSSEEKGAVELALQGYGYRWKIEEVHRHVKEQYNWQGICLRRYVALKNMNAVFWMAMFFGLYATGVSASGPVYSLEFDIPS